MDSLRVVMPEYTGRATGGEKRESRKPRGGRASEGLKAPGRLLENPVSQALTPRDAIYDDASPEIGRRHGGDALSTDRRRLVLILSDADFSTAVDIAQGQCHRSAKSFESAKSMARKYFLGVRLRLQRIFQRVAKRGDGSDGSNDPRKPDSIVLQRDNLRAEETRRGQPRAQSPKEGSDFLAERLTRLSLLAQCRLPVSFQECGLA